MPVTIDGTTGVVTPGATIGSINGILKSSSGVVSQAVAGTDYLAPGGAGTLTFATAQTISSGSTAVDFTGIPSWAKRITIIFQSVVNSGADFSKIKVGTSSGIVSTGYSGCAIYSYQPNAVFSSTYSSGFSISGSLNAAAYSGTMVLTNISSNTWIQSGANCSVSGTSVSNTTAGSIILTGILDRIRLAVDSGTLTSGTINISYEG
jgi:hypothetical protein